METIQHVGVGWCGIAREPRRIAMEIRTEKRRGRERVRLRESETERE